MFYDIFIIIQFVVWIFFFVSCWETDVHDGLKIQPISELGVRRFLLLLKFYELFLANTSYHLGSRQESTIFSQAFDDLRIYLDSWCIFFIPLMPILYKSCISDLLYFVWYSIWLHVPRSCFFFPLKGGVENC